MDQLCNLRLFYLNATFVTFCKNTCYSFHLPGESPPSSLLITYKSNQAFLSWDSTAEQNRTLLWNAANQVNRPGSAPIWSHVLGPFSSVKASGHFWICFCFLSTEDNLPFLSEAYVFRYKPRAAKANNYQLQKELQISTLNHDLCFKHLWPYSMWDCFMLTKYITRG